jgi:D-aspartate ligase
MKAPIACVIGDLSLIRALGRANLEIAAVTTDPAADLVHSRYVSRVVVAPSFAEDPHGAVTELLRFGAQFPVRPVLFFQGDDDLLAVSRERATLARYFRFALPSAELVEHLVDKVQFAPLAERLGLPAPLTYTIPRGAALDDERVRTWRQFPCILKPAVRTHWFGSHLQREIVRSHQKAIRVESREALEALLPHVAAHESSFILQEAVEGGENHVHSYHAYIRERVVVAEFTGKKVRTSPRTYGISTCVEITNDENVRNVGREVLRRLDFSGVVKLDFKEDARTGRLYLLEANPRFNLWHHPGAVAGVNLPLIVYQDLVSPGSMRPGTLRARAGVRWMAARHDLKALQEYKAAGEGGLFKWLLQLATTEVTEDLYWHDPLPGLAALVRSAARAGTRAARSFTPAKQIG